MFYHFAEIVKEPESTNSSLNEGNVTFICTVKGEMLLWYIDGHLVDSMEVQYRNVTQTSYVESGLHVVSNLSIPAKITNNNTEIICSGLGNDSSLNSSSVFLQLQG